MSTELREGSITSPLGRRLALVVGVNGQPTPSRDTLRYAIDDARDIALVLQSNPCRFELSPSSPLLGEQATTEQVREAVLALADELQHGDFALFFFSGHAEAMPIDAGMDDVYLVTQNFNPAHIKRDKNAHLSLRWLRQVLFEHEKASSVLIILDCCYAGKFGDTAPDLYLDELQQRLKYYFEGPGVQGPARPRSVRLVLTATGSTATQEKDGHGLMTGFVLSALRGERRQAVNEEGQVTFTRLFGYLDATMPSDQRPRFFGAGGELLLATHQSLSVREQLLRSMFDDRSGFLQDRLESFVGREQELAEVRQHLEALLTTGGYLTITGQAGQGKSSIIAKLVEATAKEQNGMERVAYHFIPLTPPPDYQVALLRNLMGRLILKYDLSDLFLASESRAALSEGFPRVLQEIADKGGQEIIFIDGLDQLQADQQTELRDLSFLPQGPANPPQGIVFVLGTRPNDTLHPLELLKPYREYRLPHLSRADFDQILLRRGVTLEYTLVDRFYEALDKNALYLDLIAKELATQKNISTREVEEAIRQIADNPENLFFLATQRLNGQKDLWEEVVKPVLGLLLATNEPLAREHLKQLLNLHASYEVDGDQLNRGLVSLGGLVVTDAQQRYSLFHLKFRDYLRQDTQRSNKKYVFDIEDEQRWHKRFIAWCEHKGLDQIWEDALSDITEQGRRRYARQHYLTHLYRAGDWNKLFSVLDEGLYGKAKVEDDPSTRTYALDLDLGREAAASTHWDQAEAVQHLPHLWRYTLLRCSLASSADKYPKKAFELMLLLGHDAKALGLAELLTNSASKVQIFIFIASYLTRQPGQALNALRLFSRAEQVIHTLSDYGRYGKHETVIDLATALAQAGHWQEAERAICSTYGEYRAQALINLGTILGQTGRQQEAEQRWLEAGQTIRTSDTLEERKVKPLIDLGRVLAQAGHWQEAEQCWLEAEQIISRSVPAEDRQNKALSNLGEVLAQMGRWHEAERVVHSISYGRDKDEALINLCIALAQAGRWQEAERVFHSISDGECKDRARADIIPAFVQAGRWEEVKPLIDAISDIDSKDEALVNLATAFAQAERWQEAERVINSIPDWHEDSKDEALVNLATAFAQAEHWQRAEQAIHSISDEKSKIRPLINLAIALARANRWQAAEQCWQKAERVIRSIFDEKSKGQALTNLGMALAQAGRWQEAEQAIYSISDKWYKDRALIDLGTTLAQAGRLQEAEQAIHSISDSSRRHEGLANLVPAMVRDGRWHGAEWLIHTFVGSRDRASVLVNLISAGYWQEAEQVMAPYSSDLVGRFHALVLITLTTALAQAGRWHEAEQHWQEAEQAIRSSSKRVEDEDQALAKLAIVFAQASRWQEAEQIVLSISDFSVRDEALISLVVTLTQAGRQQEAEQVISTISNGRYKDETLAKLATALAQAGCWHEAEQVIHFISDSAYVRENKVPALITLATALAQAGHRQEAEQCWHEAEGIARAISDYRFREEAQVNLSTALARVGRWQEAERVIGSISYSPSKFEPLVSFGTALARAGHRQEAEQRWHEAEQIIRSMPAGESKDEALVNLASTLVQHDEYNHLVHLVQREWLQATHRDEALNQLSLAFGLIPHHPNFGIALYDAFAWVDRFLQG